MNNREQDEKNDNSNTQFMVSYKSFHYIDMCDYLQYQYKKFTNKNG
jgi:hypothetical protein